jgi:hypothetical protein
MRWVTSLEPLSNCALFGVSFLAMPVKKEVSYDD